MVTCKAGSAALINQNVFHGNFPNVGAYAREMLAIAYRPAWAGPGSEIDPWDPEELARVSPAVRELMGDRNTRILELWRGQQASRHAPGGSRHRPQPLGTGELTLT